MEHGIHRTASRTDGIPVYRSGPPAGIDGTVLGSLLVVSAAAGFGTLAVFGKLATATGLGTATLLLFRFLVATAAL